MKILIVMDGFFPGKKYGGPPVSVDNFCTLMDNHECFIVTRNHDLGNREPYSEIQKGWNVRENYQVLYLSDSDYNKKNFENVIKNVHPDAIYLQSLFQSCVLSCLCLAKKHSIPALLAPRGELCSGAIRMKFYKKLLYIKFIKWLGLIKNIHFQSTSQEETEGIKKWLKNDEKFIHQLENIPSLPNNVYLRKSKKSGTGQFIFLSRIHQKKNLLYAIKCFADIKDKAKLDIYGPLEDKEYWEICRKEIADLPSNVVVEYKGCISHEKVHETLSQYDAFILPTLSENYGHVIAESLIVGTPVIISDQTPWRGLEKVNAGWDISLEEIKSFKEAINFIIHMEAKEYDDYRKNVLKYANQALSIEKLKIKYESVLEGLLK